MRVVAGATRTGTAWSACRGRAARASWWPAAPPRRCSWPSRTDSPSTEVQECKLTLHLYFESGCTILSKIFLKINFLVVYCSNGIVKKGVYRGEVVVDVVVMSRRGGVVGARLGAGAAPAQGRHRAGAAPPAAAALRPQARLAPSRGGYARDTTRHHTTHSHAMHACSQLALLQLA